MSDSSTSLDIILLNRVVVGALNVLIVGGCLLAAALVARLAMQRARASTQALLGRVTILCLLLIPVGVLVSPVFPFFEFPLLTSVENDKSRVQPEMEEPVGDARLTTTRCEPAVVHSLDHGERGSVQDQLPQTTRNPNAGSDATIAPVRELPLRSIELGLLIAVAIGGLVSLFLAIRLLISQLIALRLWRRSSGSLCKSVRRVVDGQIAGRLKSSRVKIRQSADVPMPVCVGLIAPGILLPNEVQDWTDDEIRCCIDHELVHADRFDLLWSTLAGVLVCLHWPNPLIWFFRRWFRQDIESACDDAVLERGNDSVTYAEMLVDFARRMSREQRVQLTAISMATVTGFRARVERIIDKTRDRRPTSPVAVVVIVVLNHVERFV